MPHARDLPLRYRRDHALSRIAHTGPRVRGERTCGCVPRGDRHRDCRCRPVVDPARLTSGGQPDFVVVTGLSGSGKSQAVKVLEDLGYYTLDNLPPALMASATGTDCRPLRTSSSTCGSWRTPSTYQSSVTSPGGTRPCAPMSSITPPRRNSSGTSSHS